MTKYRILKNKNNKFVVQWKMLFWWVSWTDQYDDLREYDVLRDAKNDINDNLQSDLESRNRKRKHSKVIYETSNDNYTRGKNEFLR